jgi:cell division inhibitor SulA
MPRYVIERAIPAIGTAERETLRDAARQSNAVLAAMQAEQKPIQWEHSYVAADKTFCIYIAANETLVQEHARRSGFPATMVTEISKMIDPTTAVS